MTRLTVATWNIGPGHVPDLAGLAADVTGCQEATDQADALSAYARAHTGVRVYQPDLRPGQSATPIVYAARLGRAKTSTRLAVGRRWVGPKGAGPTWSKAKWITHVEVDGVHYLNTHMVASVTRTRAYLGDREWEARRRHYRDHVAAIVALVGSLRGPVVLTGDFNAPPDFDLLQPLHALGFVGWTTTGTHGAERIEHVLHLRGRGLSVIGRRVVATTSDHSAVVATYDHATPEAPVFDPPAPPYLGPVAHTSAGDNKPIRRIVIHSTVSPCTPGGARKIAAYFRSPSAGGSAHYVVDPGEVVQCAYDSVVCWHAPPNPKSLGVEMCDMPSRVPGRWLLPNQRRMLRRTAALVAELCLAYGIPLRHLTVDEVRDEDRGICGHVDVSAAFGESTHWDPGAFPWRRFMRLVHQHATHLKETHR